MKKELKDYAHLYIGCQIELNESRFSEEQDDRVFTLDGVWGNSFCVKELGGYWYGFGSYHNGESHDKLLLRPLSSITNEERFERGKAIIKFGKTEIEAEYHRWMLSKGFDMFELIEAGIALDKTKIDNRGNKIQ